MKNISSNLLKLMAVLFLLPACDLEKIPPENTFVKLYPGFMQSDRIYCIYQRSDNTYFMLFKDNNQYKSSILFDYSGDTLPAQPYRYSDLGINHEIYNAIPDQSDGLIVVGSYFDNALALNIQSNQTSIYWQDPFNYKVPDGRDIAYDAIISNNKKIIVCGKASAFNYSTTNAGIAEFSKEGLRDKADTVSIERGATSIAQNPQGKYLLLVPGNNSGGVIYYFDSAWKIEGSVPTLGGQYFSQPDQAGIELLNDGACIAYTRTGIAKIGADRKSKWGISNTWVLFDEIKDLVISSDNNIVICGYKSDSLCIAKINSENQMVIWREAYLEQNTRLAIGITLSETKDKGFIVGGRSIYSSDNTLNLYLVKTDQFGKVYK